MFQSPRMSNHCAYCTCAAVWKSEAGSPSPISAAWLLALIVFPVGLARFRCSYAAKRKNLSFTSGPPTFPTKSSTCKLGFTTPPGIVGSQLFRIGQELAALGRHIYCANPWNWLVPDPVMLLKITPAVFPNSGE